MNGQSDNHINGAKDQASIWSKNNSAMRQGTEMNEKHGETLSQAITVGMTIDGRYEIVSVLGSGGFATIYKARQSRIDQFVALKVMDMQKGNDPTFQERFFREAQIAAKIRHNNVVKVFDYGMIEQTNQPYIAMELLEGHDLCCELEKNGPLSPRRAFQLFRPVIDALALGHEMGIVHKDLKPENLFLTDIGTPRECLKILDFGIARIESSRVSKLTSAGQLMGTPQYLAPEYIRFQAVSPAIDVYQMAIIMSEALSGVPAVTGDPYAVMMQHCEGHLKIADFLLDGKVGEVFYKALAVNPEARYADASAFGRALDEIAPLFNSNDTIAQLSKSKQAESQSAAGNVADSKGIRPIATTVSLGVSNEAKTSNDLNKKFIILGSAAIGLLSIAILVLWHIADSKASKKLAQASLEPNAEQKVGVQIDDVNRRAGIEPGTHDNEPRPFLFTVDIIEFYKQTRCTEENGCQSYRELGRKAEIPIHIQKVPGATILYDLDCDGDGIYERKGLSDDAVCQYSGYAGKHRIAMLGTWPGLVLCGDNEWDEDFGFSNDLAPVSIEQWGSNAWQTMQSFAQNCKNLELWAKDSPDLSHVSDMSMMFSGTEKFDQPIDHWDVSNVTNMEELFEEAKGFNHPLAGWNVSKVESMVRMFAGAVNFNQPLEAWDVSNVKNMDGMFFGARDFNQPLNKWDVSNVTVMSSMFALVATFNQPLDHWNVSKVTRMDGMFRQAQLFDRPLNTWDVSNVTDMEGMFNNAETFNQPLDAWNVSRVKTTNNMFWGAYAFNQNLDSWDMSSNQNMDGMFDESGMEKKPTWYKQ